MPPFRSFIRVKRPLTASHTPPRLANADCHTGGCCIVENGSRIGEQETNELNHATTQKTRAGDGRRFLVAKCGHTPSGQERHQIVPSTQHPPTRPPSARIRLPAFLHPSHVPCVPSGASTLRRIPRPSAGTYRRPIHSTINHAFLLKVTVPLTPHRLRLRRITAPFVMPASGFSFLRLQVHSLLVYFSANTIQPSRTFGLRLASGNSSWGNYRLMVVS